MEIINTIFLILLGAGYLWLATWPKRTAFLLVNFFEKKKFETGKPESFWNLYDEIRLRRRIIITVVAAAILSVSITDVVLLNRVRELLFPGYGTGAVVAAIVLLLSVGYSLVEFTGYGKISIPPVEHGRKAEVDVMLDTLSIAAGTTAPKSTVLSHAIPTAFSIHTNEHDTIVYVTSALLNMASKTELEAVLAHEVSNHAIKRNTTLRLISNLLGLFNVLSYLLLLLVLYSIDPSWLTLWLVNTASSYLRSVKDFDFAAFGDNSSPMEYVTMLSNPLLLLSKLFSHAASFSLSRKEFLYSDLRAIELTRYPQGLYSILNKMLIPIHAFRPLPVEYGHLYFTGEYAQRAGEPMAQPPTAQRIRIIEELDSKVKVSALEKAPPLHCPVCNSSLLPCKAISMYNHGTVWYACLNSSHLWFDNSALYYLSNETALAGMKGLKFKKTGEEYGAKTAKYECPRCKVRMHNIADRFLPSSIQIYHCPSCEGDLVSREDFETYVKFRRERQPA